MSGPKKIAIAIATLILLFSTLAITFWNQLTVERKIASHLVSDSFFDQKATNLMIGSSTIERIKLKTNLCGRWLNRGIGASVIADNVNYLRMSPLSIQPSYILIYAGENDLFFYRDLNAVKISFLRLINTIKDRFQQAKIVLIPLKPAPKRTAIEDSIHRFNVWINDFATKQPSIEVLNIQWTDHEKNALFIEDKLHLTTFGYNLILNSLDTQCNTLGKNS